MQRGAGLDFCLVPGAPRPRRQDSDRIMRRHRAVGVVGLGVVEGSLVDPALQIVRNQQLRRAAEKAEHGQIRTDLHSGAAAPSDVLLARRMQAVSATRTGDAAVSKSEDAAEVQLSSRRGPQPIQSGAPSRHEASLQAKTICCHCRVARSRGIDRRSRDRGRAVCRRASVTLTPPAQ